MYINSNICFKILELSKNNVHVILRRASGFYFRFINILYECMYCLKEHDCYMVYTHKPSYHSIYDKISSKQMGKKNCLPKKSRLMYIRRLKHTFKTLPYMYYLSCI
jgi:hypothetical protein